MATSSCARRCSKIFTVPTSRSVTGSPSRMKRIGFVVVVQLLVRRVRTTNLMSGNAFIKGI